MPYYCTVPRCTSMAGKAKNVSFHQFPRDEELAKLWNRILKRGKPYTKYSKVCSLHFRQEDYTINSVGKKGQWRSLRKDAIPSQNLPPESPTPQQRRSSCSRVPPPLPPSLMDPQIQQQFAQAIYVQTMLAMQAANFIDNSETMDLSVKNQDSRSDSESSTENQTPPPTPLNLTPNTELQTFLNTYKNINLQTEKQSYKCPECPKYFKDPDVFLLHKRTHQKSGTNQEMLNSNPILANLLKQKMPESNLSEKSDIKAISDKIAMALTMEAYVRNLSAYKADTSEIDDLNESEESNRLVIDETA